MVKGRKKEFRLIIPSQISREKKLKPSAKMLLALLMFRQGSHPNSYWLEEEMAEDLGISARTVRRDIKLLKRNGYINVEVVRAGKIFHNVYTVINSRSEGQNDLSKEEVSRGQNGLPRDKLERSNWNFGKDKLVFSGGQNGRVKRTLKRKGKYTLSERMKISLFLLRKIKDRNPKFKEPNLEDWADVVDLMVREDGRKPEEIKKVIEWSQDHLWWQNRILSMYGVRKNFDQLWMQMKAEQEGSTEDEARVLQELRIQKLEEKAEEDF